MTKKEETELKQAAEDLTLANAKIKTENENLRRENARLGFRVHDLEENFKSLLGDNGVTTMRHAIARMELAEEKYRILADKLQTVREVMGWAEHEDY